jgi:predicted  nucleic acid-binding Zn-ribbon protein
MMRGSGHKPGRFQEDSMKRTEYSSVCARLLGVALVTAAFQGPALAQADNKTLSGKSSSSGKVLTRDELRACMKQQASLATRKTELETRQNAVAAEREQVQKDTDAIKAEQESLGSRKGAVDDLNARMTAFSAKVKDLQERRDDFEKSGRGGPTAERERRKLEKEAAEIEKEQTQLNAERDKLQAGGNEAVNKLNARVEAQQQVAQAWNDKSKKLSADQQAYEDDRIAWLDNCGNRRFREDDERAIKAGK